MTFSRFTESELRQLIDVLQLVENPSPEELAKRLDQLRRNLAPEDEFALVLSWLGRCRLVHKLGQEQLPLGSTDTYRVPDLLAIVEYKGKVVPVLIEVKKSEPKDPTSLEEGRLSLKPGYMRYAEEIGLPILVAWRHRSFWTLFEMTHARSVNVNHRIGFFRAMEENLMGVLAGDFSYRVAPGTAIRMRIKKITEADRDGGFVGEIHDVHFVNPAGQRIPNIPYLASLFFFWENEVEQIDQGAEVIQSFVIPDVEHGEFASRTLGKILHALGGMKKAAVNWRAVIHDGEHWAHEGGQLRTLVEAGAEHGVIAQIIDFRPQHMPMFLTG